jgi:hypothetical protein
MSMKGERTIRFASRQNEMGRRISRASVIERRGADRQLADLDLIAAQIKGQKRDSKTEARIAHATKLENLVRPKKKI